MFIRIDDVVLNTAQWVLDDSSNDKGVKDETTY